MLHSFMSSLPSTSEMLPQKTTKPLAGFCLKSLRCWMMRSSADNTFLRVLLLLMFAAVDFS